VLRNDPRAKRLPRRKDACRRLAAYRRLYESATSSPTPADKPARAGHVRDGRRRDAATHSGGRDCSDHRCRALRDLRLVCPRCACPPPRHRTRRNDRVELDPTCARVTSARRSARTPCASAPPFGGLMTPFYLWRVAHPPKRKGGGSFSDRLRLEFRRGTHDQSESRGQVTGLCAGPVFGNDPRSTGSGQNERDGTR